MNQYIYSVYLQLPKCGKTFVKDCIWVTGNEEMKKDIEDVWIVWDYIGKLQGGYAFVTDSFGNILSAFSS